MGCVFLGESKNEFVISDHSDHAASKEPTNPFPENSSGYSWDGLFSETEILRFSNLICLTVKQLETLQIHSNGLTLIKNEFSLSAQNMTDKVFI